MCSRGIWRMMRQAGIKNWNRKIESKKEKEGTNTFELVYSLVRKVPEGKVATYGQIACMIGNPRLSRVVGYAMSSCPYDDVPCHRIVNRLGELAKSFGEDGNEVQKYLLEKEGIKFDKDNRINLKKYGWNSENKK